MEKRHLKRQRLLELWINLTSTSMMIVAIVNISNPAGPFPNASLILAILSVVTLVGSLQLSAARLPERRLDAFLTYRAIQNLRVRVDQLPSQHCTCNWARELEDIEAEYEQLIDKSENHTERDYYRSLRSQQRSDAIEGYLATRSSESSSAAPEVNLGDETESKSLEGKPRFGEVNGARLRWWWLCTEDWVVNNWPYLIFVVPILTAAYTLQFVFSP